MLRRAQLIVCTGLLIIAGGLFASEEEFIEWENVKIVTNARKETGKISFEASTEGELFKSVTITTFGKSYSVGPKDLQKLSGFSLRTLAISHEAGYKELGGHTVHFRMKRSFYKAKILMEEIMLISVSKGKGLALQGPMPK